MIKIKCLASGSKGNSYAIDDGSTILLLEAGISANRINTGLFKIFGINYRDRVCGCLVTHEHDDHAIGAIPLSNVSVDIYSSEKTLRLLKGERKQPLRLNTVKSGHTFELGTWIILPWNAQHDAEEPLGYLLYSTETHERVLFATDTYYIPNTFRNLNYIMVECNYSLNLLNESVATGIVSESRKTRILGSHFSLDNVKDFLNHNDLSAVQRIYLIHVSGQNGDKTQFEREIIKHTGLPVTVF